MTKMRCVQDQDVIETLFSDSPYPTLGKGVGIGCLVRGANNLQVFGVKNCVESSCEFGVIVMDQEAKLCFPIRDLPNQLSGLLRCPVCIRIGCDTRDVYTARTKLDEEEHIESP